MNKAVVLYSIASGICLAFACYAFLGALQGVWLYSGERQSRNLVFWLPFSLFFGGFGVFFGYRGMRASLLSLKGRRAREPR